MLLVGYIKPNTTNGQAEGVNGNITIKVYLDKNKILISDTYDGTESDSMGTTNNQADGKTVLTTAEWNALQTSGVSFKVKVEANEGIWVKQTLDDILRVKNINITTGNPIKDNENSEFVNNQTPGVNFGAISSDSNGKGIYMKADTENDSYPILYYRGAVEDNNVYFADLCWKMVRTTNTGGVKLIYNGENSASSTERLLDENDYESVSSPGTPFKFDNANKTWYTTIAGTIYPSIYFTLPAGDNYSIVIDGTTELGSGGSIEIYKNTTFVNSFNASNGTPYSGQVSLGTLSSTDVIEVIHHGGGSYSSPININFKIVQNGTALDKNKYTLKGTNYSFDTTTKKWVTTTEQNMPSTAIINVKSSGYYYISLVKPTGGPFYIYKGDTTIETSSNSQKINLGYLSKDDNVIIDYYQYSPDSISLSFSLSKIEFDGIDCTHVYSPDAVLKEGNKYYFKYNNSSTSLASFGYMYGNLYEGSSRTIDDTMVFGSGFTYENGIYKLVNSQVGIDSNHHYTCFTNSDTCSGTNANKIYYIYYKYNTSYDYITLQNGKSVEEAISEMNENKNDSIAKQKVESWFYNRMLNYINQIEDTNYCNDRSIQNLAGWNPSGGQIDSGSLLYKTYNRMINNSPNLNCINKNDSFTWKNGSGNKKLIYPVGLITSDEVILAGDIFNTSSRNYMYSSSYFWTMSPYTIASYSSSFRVGNGITPSYADGENALRPIISLKPGTPVVSGTGTVNDPYVIE